MIEILEDSSYILKLDKEFFQSEFCCLGSQLIKILDTVKYSLPNIKWYAFDVEFSTLKSKRNDYSEMYVSSVSKTYSTNELIENIRHINQFDYGVFMAFPEDCKVEWDISTLPSTENLWRLQHHLCLMEIRLFDYSAFEIYTRDASILQRIIENKDNK